MSLNITTITLQTLPDATQQLIEHCKTQIANQRTITNNTPYLIMSVFLLTNSASIIIHARSQKISQITEITEEKIHITADLINNTGIFALIATLLWYVIKIKFGIW